MNKCQKFIRNLYIIAAVICFAGCGLSPNILEGHTYALAGKTITASFSADTVAINDIGALPYSLSERRSIRGTRIKADVFLFSTISFALMCMIQKS